MVVQQVRCESYLEDNFFPFGPVRSCEPGVMLFYDFVISSFLLSTLKGYHFRYYFAIFRLTLYPYDALSPIMFNDYVHTTSQSCDLLLRSSQYFNVSCPHCVRISTEAVHEYTPVYARHPFCLSSSVEVIPTRPCMPPVSSNLSRLSESGYIN